MVKRRRGGQAVRGGASASALPPWLWLLAGVFLGLALAALFIARDWAPSGPALPRPDPTAQPPAEPERPLAEEPREAPRSQRPRYDFYTVLPEMEVVVPDAELTARVRASSDAPETGQTRYLLQAGSFRRAEDAEAVKAQIALSLALTAQIQTVTIDSTTWHRVRLGPFASAREVEDAKRSLAQQGIEAITLRESG